LKESGNVDREQGRDLEWVQRAAAGDHEAYERLYRAHVGRVHSLCLRMARDRGQAEELTQDVFVRAWEKLEQYRGDSSFSTWLHRLAVNFVVGEFRKRSRWREIFASSSQSSPPPEALSTSPPTVDLELDRAIAGLPERARLVFVLHDIEGYKHSEIASLMGSAVGTSKAHLHRARQLLREALKG
jgi:RNA polymerase sigma-70 factor (ECF subfamily)